MSGECDFGKNALLGQRRSALRLKERRSRSRVSRASVTGKITGSMNSIPQPDSLGHWGQYGGRFVPETLMAPLDELTAAYFASRDDESFQSELHELLTNYA